MFFSGLLGEYICRIYDEVKCRPLYIIEGSDNLEAKNAAPGTRPRQS
ncbi:MAG: hypothetical protein Q4B42_05875 [Oscillospiraceae bacterium]|nr:hypothetical protein [Oscillospiraceae bacterium]